MPGLRGGLKEELLQQLADAVVEMDEEKARETAAAYVQNKFDPYEAIELGLSEGMRRVGRLYEEEEYFIPELLMCSDAMYAGLDIIRPHLKRETGPAKHRVVIGVVQGDTHDIGKNLVKIMLESSGFEVIDLGRDVPLDRFVAKARSTDAELLALSTLMTTAMDGMKDVISMLERENLRDRIKVMVGGGPVSRDFAERIGADGYAADAAEAVKLARSLVSTAAYGR
ncbi:Methionine synthase [Moorella thermoacetica]|uniref:corrinoid protein n=1 Tax=Neomoorella thermoacetica TaxID=1525 RepID=UPI0030CC9281